MITRSTNEENKKRKATKKRRGMEDEDAIDEADFSRKHLPTSKTEWTTQRWPDFAEIPKSTDRQSRSDNLFSMLLMEDGSAPPLQETESSSGPSSNESRPPIASHSNVEELPSMFPDATEEDSLTHALEEPTFGSRARNEIETARQSNAANVGEEDIFPLHSQMNDQGDDWSEWREMNKEFATKLQSPMSMLSSSTISSPLSHAQSSARSRKRFLGSQDAVSVNSDLSCLTRSFSEHVMRNSLTMKKLSDQEEDRALQAMAEKARVLSIEPRPSTAKKKVRFNSVGIRSYQRILDSNPSCTSGPPVGLGWQCSPERSYEINRFEAHREHHRRVGRQLLMPRSEREAMLKGLGYTDQELAQAIRRLVKVQNQRKQTVNNLGAELIEEQLENAKRKVKSLFVGDKVDYVASVSRARQKPEIQQGRREVPRVLEQGSSLSRKLRQSVPKKTVRFHSVHVRSYQRILEINPSCTSGPPIGLGWNYSPERSYEINLFENSRHPSRRTQGDLLLPRAERESMLRALGYTEQDLAYAVRQLVKAKTQRKQTVNNLGVANIEEKVESAGRKVKHLFAFGKV